MSTCKHRYLGVGACPKCFYEEGYEAGRVAGRAEERADVATFLKDRIERGDHLSARDHG